MLPWLEKNLLRKIKSGDEASFAQVYDLHVDKLYRFVFLKTNSAEISEEIVQDVFTKFWQYVCKQEDDSIHHVRAFLYQIARNLVIDYYRSRHASIKEVPLDDVLTEAELAASAATESDLGPDAKYSFALIEQSLTSLPAAYQDVIIMKFVNDLSHREIAEIMGKTENNIRVLIHRALTALREKLKESTLPSP